MTMNQNHPKRSGLRTVREIALTVGAVAGVICIVATLAALFFGVTPLMFRSGSMSPTINTGALALAHTVPATEVAAGDVISIDDAQGARLTHRVVSVDSVAGNTAVVQLKGDANEQADVEPYAITTADRVFFHVDGLGYVTAWLSSPVALFVGGLTAGLLIFTAFRPNGRRRKDDTPGGPGGDPESSESGATAQPSAEATKARTLPRSPLVLGVALLTLVGFADISGTSAAFTDAATAKSGAFGAKADFVPVINTAVSGYRTFVGCDSLGNDRITVSWAHLGAPYTYRIAIRTINDPTYIYMLYDVTPPVGTAAGATVTSDFGPYDDGSFVAFAFDYEIHTVLPSSGAAGSVWRGTRINRPPFGSTRARCGTPLGSNITVDKNGDDPVPQGTPAPFARQRQSLAEAPDGGSETTSATTTPSETTTPSVTSEPSTSGTTTPGASTPGASTTTPSPTTTPSVTTATPTPKEAALTPPVTSTSGDYAAQIVQSDTGPSAVIRDGATEVYRTDVSASDTVEWVTGTDDLRITTASGVWLVSKSSGKWVKTEVVPPAAAAAPIPTPEAEEKKLPPTGEPDIVPPAGPSIEESVTPTS